MKTIKNSAELLLRTFENVGLEGNVGKKKKNEVHKTMKYEQDK
mgnify:CR=1 FL=1